MQKISFYPLNSFNVEKAIITSTNLYQLKRTLEKHKQTNKQTKKQGKKFYMVFSCES